MATQSKTTEQDAAVKTTHTAHNSVLIDKDDLQAAAIQVEKALHKIQEVSSETALSDSERRRMLGSGVRRYGFIDKVSDVADANADFMPPFFNILDLKALLRQLEEQRNINSLLRQMLRMNTDNLLITGDEAFRLALMYYNSVREAARRRVPGAESILRMLQLFFQRPRQAGAEPTHHEIERDIKALLKGTRDGEIIVRKRRPAATGAISELIDETRPNRRHNAFKATVEEKE